MVFEAVCCNHRGDLGERLLSRQQEMRGSSARCPVQPYDCGLFLVQPYDCGLFLVQPYDCGLLLVQPYDCGLLLVQPYDCGLLLVQPYDCGLLLVQRPSNMLVYLRGGSARTIVRAATLSQKLRIQLSISPSHSILTPGQPVLRTPGAWSANFEVTGMTRHRKMAALAGIEPWISRSGGGHFNHQP